MGIFFETYIIPVGHVLVALLNAHSMSAKSTEALYANGASCLNGNGNAAVTGGDGKRQHDAQHAFADLMQWTKMVMDELLALKWRQVGVERMQDGSTEPLIVRKNPNLAIDDLVKRCVAGPTTSLFTFVEATSHFLFLYLWCTFC